MRFAVPIQLLAAAAAVLVLSTGAQAKVSVRDVCDKGLPARLMAGPFVETSAAKGGDAFVVLYSGDGGWAKADCEFSHLLAERGLPVIGVNSVRYFAKHRTPDAAAADLARLIDDYSARWGKAKVVLMGYSFGASALPIIADRLPAAERAKVEEMVLAGPGQRGELVLRPRTWFGRLAANATPVEPAIEQLAGLRVVCVYGEHDQGTACPRFKPGEVELHPVPGKHRFKGAYAAVVDAVTETRPAQ